MRLCVVIPAYNEEKAIGITIREYRNAFPEARIVVIDNNSKDSTAETAHAELDLTRDVLLTEPRQGKGFAIKSGLARIDADIYIMTDGDATYPATDARRLLEKMLQSRADMVVGDRISSGAYASQNTRGGHSWGNRLLTFVISNLAGEPYCDVLSGLRVMSRPFVAGLDIRSSGFQLETEMNVIAAYLRASVVETPIAYRARPEDSHSKLNTVRDGARILNFALTNWVAFSPMQPFLILAAMSIIGMLLLLSRIVVGFMSGYVAAGSTYSTTAAMAAAAGLVAVCSFFFGVSLRILGRNDRRREIADFQERKRRWNARLDTECGIASKGTKASGAGGL